MEKLKNAIVTWIAAYLLITGLLIGLNAYLNEVPLYIRTLILSGLMVFLLQYLVFPFIHLITQKIKK
ncbi:MAG: hypothetical protein AAF242_18720 [Bacteroidota bacterium]